MEVDDVVVLVAEDLDFDVFGALDVSFEEDGGVSEGVLSFCLGFCEEARELGGFFHDAHSAAAATEGCFDDEGEADFVGDGKGDVGVCEWFFGAGEGGDVVFLSEGAGSGFVAHVFEEVWGGADEDDAFAGAGAGEGGVFREEAVAWVDHGDAFGFGEFDDAFVVEVGTDGAFGGVELVCFVGFEAVDGEAVFFCEDGDGAEAEFGGGAEDADGDFAAIGSEDF